MAVVRTLQLKERIALKERIELKKLFEQRLKERQVTDYGSE